MERVLRAMPVVDDECGGASVVADDDEARRLIEAC
jgi:hypothetical protein